MASAEIVETMSVDRDKLFSTIIDYERYPKFVDGCTEVQVQRNGAGQARVRYKVSMMKDVTYTLDHKEDLTTGVIEWTLVESDTFKKNSGRWELESKGPGKTQAKYQIELEFK